MRTFRVDFNEMLEHDLVLLSKDDYRPDINNELILLSGGMEVALIADDVNERGEVDNLVATGIVELNAKTGWGGHVKWCCRINDKGIRHESECAGHA